MDTYRVRVAVADEPGRLGAAAAALGEFGINIVDVDVHTIDGRSSADDLLIEITRPVDLPLIEHVLRQVDCELLFLERVDPHRLSDATVRALELGLHLARNGAQDDEVTEAAGALVRAEWVWIDPATSTSTSAASEAARRSTPVHRRERVLAGDAWVLAVPMPASAGSPRVLCLSRERLRFSFTETARVQALLRFITISVGDRH